MPRSNQASIKSGLHYLTIITLLLTAGWFCHFNTRTSATAAPQQEATSLELGKPIGREIKGGETHTYRVAAAAAQFFHVIIEQRGADVAVTLVGPDGSKLFEIDSPNGTEGPEPVLWVAETPGNYRIEVRTSEEQAKAARYEARLEVLRASTDSDRTRVAATYATAEAEHLFDGDAVSKRSAIAKFTEALELWRKLADQHGIAAALTALGDLHRGLNEPQQALEAYQQVLPYYRALNDPQEEAATLSSIGIIYDALGDKQQAIAYLQQALPLRRAAKDQFGEATTLNSLGTVYYTIGQFRQALAIFEQALPLRRAAKDRVGEANTLNSLGETYRRLGEKRKGLKYFQQALPLCRSTRNAACEAQALNSIGVIYSDLGEMQRALDAYNQALPLRRDPATRAITLINIGRAYAVLGASQEALRYYEQALQIARTAGAKRTEAQTLNFMGLAHWSAGEYQKALEYLNQALPLRRELKDPADEAETLNNLGLVYNTLDDRQRALEAYNQALPLLRAAGNRFGEAYTLNNLGFVYEALGEQQKALTYHEQALKLSREVGDRLREAKIRYGIARLESARGRLKQARGQIEQTIKIAEAIRAKLTDQNLRAEYRASVQRYYDLYIDVLMRLHKRLPGQGFSATALNASERARARSLLELLTEAGADIRQGAAPELIERERELQEQLNDKSAEQIRLVNSQAKPAQLAAISQELAQLTSDLRATQNQIRTNNPRYAALTQPEPLTAAAIQRQLLTPDTLLLEYSLGEERSYLWVVSQAALRAYTLPKRETIEMAARRYYELLTARNQFITNETRQAKETRIAQADAELPAAGAELSRMVLGPVAALLRNQRLLVVSDGALQYVPFTTLPLNKRTGERVSGRAGENAASSPTPPLPHSPTPPLIAQHEITVLPSASTLAVLRRETANRPAATKSLAVFADPVFESQDERVKKAETKAEKKADAAQSDTSRVLLIKAAKESGASVSNVEFRVPRLPYTRNEAEAILALTQSNGGKSAFDFAANRAAALSDDLSQYRIIHFATHGFLNSLNPELSGLVLALVDEQGAPQNGYLFAPEVYNLKLDSAELVVLSACQTGLGKEVAGEGMVGLTRGFMYAGAPRVVVSLWSVNDRATADLMKAFYQGMLKQGLRPAAALRAAQLALWKQKQWQAPYYWAAFTLQGEWR